ncbi:hypothetical protein [Verrucomicrobium spinosum]|uniref:hypothetical protein n=1 Tax=Verrucomicrobium spinosum TaxID=2736 RepID=UPI0001746315|nr:hypothetical protein [Verrucomicrobium spinosum]
MKTSTSILEDLDIDEDTLSIYRREAVRRKVPVMAIIKEKLLEAAREMNAKSNRRQGVVA